MNVNDVSGLTPAAVASALYRKPGLLHKVARWDGGSESASQRSKPASTQAAAAPQHAKYSFDPFDQKSWWKSAKIDAAKTDAAKADAAKADASTASTSKFDSASAKPSASWTLPKFSFNPFDQTSWWKQTKGTGIDVSA
jgi:hypothetical protein